LRNEDHIYLNKKSEPPTRSTRGDRWRLAKNPQSAIRSIQSAKSPLMRKLSVFTGIVALFSAIAASGAQECSGFKISSSPANCSADHFTYRIFQLDENLNLVTVNETGVLNSEDMNHFFTVCDQGANYAVELSNQGAPAFCSPVTWSLIDLQGNEFFNTTSCSFKQASQAYFTLGANGFHYLKNVVDFHVTSSCYHNNTVAPETEAPTEMNDNSAGSKGFWLHTFWGIFLIAVFSLIGLILLLILGSACILACARYQETTDGERKSLIEKKKRNNSGSGESRNNNYTGLKKKKSAKTEGSRQSQNNNSIYAEKSNLESNPQV
jgi:hypothetical protein